MTTHPRSPTDHDTLGRTFVDAAWKRDTLDDLDGLCAPDLVVHDPANPTTGTGPEAYRRFVSRVTDGATDVEVAIDDAVGDDGTVAIRTSGTLGGFAQDGDPDGATDETAISGFEVLHVESGRVVEWAGTVLPDRVLEEFRAGFAGDVICPGDADYDDARAVWNGVIDRYPGLVLRCSGVADVIDAVNLTSAHDLLVTVRGGGHNVAGAAVCDGGIVIDLSAMTGVWVDPDERTAWVQAGATLGDVDRETQAFGLATPLGVVSATGVAGLTLGGGLGHLRNKYGLSADNLASVDVVTTDGEYLTASPNEHADLFWGLRGGGGNFGVVTGFEFDLHPVGPEVAVLLAVYHADDGDAVMRGFREYAQSTPDELSIIASRGTHPDEALFPADVVDEPKIVIVGMYAGSPAQGGAVIEPLRELAEPVADLSGTMPYTDFQRAFDETAPDGSRYYWKSLYLDSLSDDVVDRIFEWGDAAPSPLSTIDVWALGGAVADVGLDESAFIGRDAPYLLAVEAHWEDPGDDEANIAWAREFLEEMHQYSDGSLYLNFPGFYEDGDRLMDRTFGDAYARLSEVKTRYDPENVFRSKQHVKPAG
ncbi:FAD-binding protein [Natronorarus salvus]|uniref:FAD-binding protein n=1 Tax=Natronorarus salvus TaxID=3117733 RepID=UPI002F260471